MSNRTLGLIVLVVGILIVIGVIFSHQLGLSSSAVFGLKKIAGIIVGAIVAVVGLVLSMRKQLASK